MTPGKLNNIVLLGYLANHYQLCSLYRASQVQMTDELEKSK
jgi:hypothetical protein